MPSMRAALCALLIALSSIGSVDSRALQNSHAVYCVTSLRSGGRDSLQANSATCTTNPSVNRRTTGSSMALLLPLIEGRKRGHGSWKRAQDASDHTRARITNERDKVSPEAPVSSTLASLIGAIVASGFTSGLWPEAVGASPFDPRPAPKSSLEPFFEGWFIRLVDHEQRLSFAVILGSFRSRGGTELDQHYVSLSYLHKPKAGTLPTERGSADDSNHNGEDIRGRTGDVGALSPQAGTSKLGKRFLEWARGEWLTALSGFGAKGGSETWRSSRGKPEAGRGGHGSTVGAKASVMVSSSSGRNFDVDADVDVDCMSGEVKGPSDEAGGKILAPDCEDGLDMLSGEDSAAVMRNQERLRPEDGFRSIGEHGARLLPQSHAAMQDLNDPPRHRDDEPPLIPLRETSVEGTHTFHAFPPPETVTISRRGAPVDREPNLRDESSFTWEADGIGHFTVDGDMGRLSFQLPELSVAASFRNRQPWSRKWPNAAGPEGWLSRTRLLPLHYFVHSLGSEAGYSLKAADAPRAVVGRGSIHMECNYGTCFPTGWIWAQGCSVTQGLCGNFFRDGEIAEGAGEVEGDSSAHFVMTGGRFVIGPATTNSFVLAFRSSRHHWDFRTTDLDRISVEVCRRENRVKIVARSFGDSRVLEAPGDSFGSAIYVPTPEGFSNSPGCIESYAATAKFRLYTKDRERKGGSGQRALILREEIAFKLAALEFGGSYQDT